MEQRSAKLLDEACNRNNEVYCDEMFYGAWLDAPHATAEYEPISVPGVGRTDVIAFLAGLDATRRH